VSSVIVRQSWARHADVLGHDLFLDRKYKKVNLFLIQIHYDRYLEPACEVRTLSPAQAMEDSQDIETTGETLPGLLQWLPHFLAASIFKLTWTSCSCSRQLHPHENHGARTGGGTQTVPRLTTSETKIRVTPFTDEAAFCRRPQSVARMWRSDVVYCLRQLVCLHARHGG
jgi:hypothetical protein